MSACPYCLNTIDESADTVTCDACGAAHHRECWLENGGCCVQSCEKVSRNVEIDVPAEGRERVVLSRESVQSARKRRQRQDSNPCVKCGRQVREGELYCSECTPARAESQDVRNLGPILVVVAIVVLTLIWVFILTSAPDNNLPRPAQTRTETKTNR